MQNFIKLSLVPLVFIASWIFYERGKKAVQAQLDYQAQVPQPVGLEPSELATPVLKPEVAEKAKQAAQVALPDFAAIADVRQKKQAFVDFILPAIRAANHDIQQERIFLKQLKIERMTDAQRVKFETLAEKYQQPQKKDQTLLEWHAELLKKVDIIPPALALAQAANESAWGTSRFALDGMNFFGQWCFSVGCGLVPDRRPEGQTYEVRLFASPEESVGAYMLNLNAFHTYEDLREIRAIKRANNKPLSSEALAEGLLAYSTKREVYIAELKSMIRFNKWQSYDAQPW